VMPNGLPFFDNLPEVELWVPMAFEADDSMGTRNNHFINLVGRLKPDTTPAQAQADVSAIAERIAERFPSNKGVGALIVPMQEQLAGDSRNALLVLLGAVAFVLLVACLNVANLLLARASARQRELAIRASLGASRARIIRQVIVECLPIGLLGGALGALLAWWGINFLSSLLPSTLPRGNAIEINGRVLVFTLGLSLLTILLFGLLPAFYSSRSDVQRALNEGGRSGIGGRRQGRLRRLLIIAEVAIALVLLAASGLMVRTFIKLRQVDIGFTGRNVLTMQVPLPETKYPFPLTAADPREPAGLAFSEKLLSRIKSLPGVTSAATASTLPLGAGVGWGKLLNIDSRPATSLDQMPDVRFGLVSDDYFRTFGISVRQGRSFNAQDQSNSQPVAIINETLAQRFFPNENPIGKSVTMGPPAELLPADERGLENLAPHRIIVGVVSDVKGGSLNQPTPAQVYAPLTQHRREGWVNVLMLAVQTNVPPASLTSAIREQVRGLDPDLPLTNIQTVDDLLSRTLSQAKFSLLLLGLFSVVGLLLAAIGIYGVMATTVAQRTQEFGVRIALGAQAGDVLRLVVGQGMMLIALGIVAGLVTAFAVTRLMSSLLFGVSPNDPTTLAAITVLLVTVALLACYIPARRATKVDPLVALRYE
jgi:putative ABC transport system permease protein